MQKARKWMSNERDPTMGLKKGSKEHDAILNHSIEEQLPDLDLCVAQKHGMRIGTASWQDSIQNPRPIRGRPFVMTLSGVHSVVLVWPAAHAKFPFSD
jgi:hypothetical protein